MNNRQITFEFEPYAIGCCGAIAVTNFNQEDSYFFEARKFDTKEEVITAFNHELKERVHQQFEDDRKTRRGAGYQGLITLVRRYGRTKRHQFPELEEHLLKTGWKEVTEWKNNNTGNTCVLLTKFLTKRG